MKKKDGKKMMDDGPRFAKEDMTMKMSMEKPKSKAKKMDGKMKMSKGKKACKM
jgi:hypothetical protein